MELRQYATFFVQGHLLGIDILDVREINRALEITPVPGAPPYVRGLLNLRGQILTVFDLAVRLGLPPGEAGPDSHNVILKHDSVGLMVDSIGDVIQAEEKEIEPPPANIGGIASEYVDGVVKLSRDLMVILSADSLLKYRSAAETAH